jgi:hypothetical protein
MQPNDAELHASIERMEARLRGHPLFPAYERLVHQFRADLLDERDVLLSRAAVLMLLQETASDAERSRGE